MLSNKWPVSQTPERNCDIACFVLAVLQDARHCHCCAARAASARTTVCRTTRLRTTSARKGTLLYQLVEQHYPAFREMRAMAGRSLPDYIEDEFDAYLKCGRLEEGFLRVRCEHCHASWWRSAARSADSVPFLRREAYGRDGGAVG